MDQSQYGYVPQQEEYYKAQNASVSVGKLCVRGSLIAIYMLMLRVRTRRVVQEWLDRAQEILSACYPVYSYSGCSTTRCSGIAWTD